MSKISNFVTNFYANKFLANKSVDNNKLLFLITETHDDNCVALLDYLLKFENNKQFVIIVDDSINNKYQSRYSSAGVCVLKKKSDHFRAIKEMVTAKYVFFMHRRPYSIIHKRKEQVVVNLWHGSGYKKESHISNWVDGRDFDYVLVPGPVFIKTKSVFFSCNESRVLPLGYPRYDILMHTSPDSSRLCEAVEALTESKSSKLIIWLPTFRKSNNRDVGNEENDLASSGDIPLLKTDEDFELIDSICQQNNLKLLIKRHPYQVVYSCENKKYSNIIFCGNDDLEKAGISLYELLCCTDGLISDYSSVSIDYMLLNKPMSFVLDDYEEYKNSRGFVFDDPLHYMPGSHIYSVQDMIGFLTEIANDVDSHMTERTSIMYEVHNPCDNYCERIWETVKQFDVAESK